MTDKAVWTPLNSSQIQTEVLESIVKEHIRSCQTEPKGHDVHISSVHGASLSGTC